MTDDNCLWADGDILDYAFADDDDTGGVAAAPINV